MSLETWKKEFYPIDAKLVPVADAVAHSLKKWEGLLLENLARHEVFIWLRPGFHQLKDGSGAFMRIDSDTCALCANYFLEPESDGDCYDDDDGFCKSCPLSIERGGVPCDAEGEGECGPGLCGSPWGQFANSNDGPNPRPMIHWLQRTLANEPKT